MLMDGSANYFAIAADLIGSRRKNGSMAPRAETRLDLFNQDYRDYIAALFTFSQADELRGVVRNDCNLPRLVRQLRYYLRPFLLRIGIGFGTVDCSPDQASAWMMDGSGFVYALESFQKIKNAKRPATCFTAHSAELTETVNVLYTLIDAVQNRWSEKQRQAVDAYERCGTYELAGKHLSITPQNVNKHCREADWKAIIKSEAYLDYLIKKEL